MNMMSHLHEQDSQQVDPLNLALADELLRMTHILADLAYDLGSHPETLRRHMASLQSIDNITQMQIAVAEMLRSDASTEERIALVTLEGMAARLRAATSPGAAPAPETETAPEEE